MWFKNLFGTKQIQQQPPQQNIDTSQFEVEQTNEQSSPLIDHSPDLRYQSIDQTLTNHQKIPFPHNVLDKSQTIVFCKVQPDDGFTCRSTHSTPVSVKILFTDKQLLLSPNVFALSFKSLNQNFLAIPLGQIQKIDRHQVKKQPLSLYLTLKDNKQLIFANKLGDEITNFCNSLTKFTQPNGINKFFAFQYRKKYHSNNKPQHVQKSWQLYNIRRQFMRQGAYKHFSIQQNEKQFKYAFRLVKNHSFDISETYPSQFVIPFSITKDQVIKASKFRTRQRVPALTYFYQYKPQCFVTLFRCSQIKTGVMGNRCQQDEKIIRQISQSSNFISKTKKIYQKNNLKIYDARGYYAALGNMLAGKGYERQDTYNCDVQFLNIPNIHAVRDSYNQVKSSNSSNGVYEVITSSCWLEYVGLILTGANEMAIDMLSGKNVLVHCSDGWDRTAQLSSLSQLLLDPYFRTVEGIAVLIEKDWRNFGHKFRQRTGQYHPTSYHPYEKSPIFIQFLDCIYQLQCQFPLSFEYNSYFLEFLAKHVNSCIYGTFLTNNMKEASQVKIESQTISIWSDIIFSDSKEDFLNPFYRQDLNSGFLNVNLDMKNLNVWQEHLFCEKGPLQEALFSYKKERLINKAFREQFYANEKLINQLKKQLGEENVCI